MDKGSFRQNRTRGVLARGVPNAPGGRRKKKKVIPGKQVKFFWEGKY